MAERPGVRAPYAGLRPFERHEAEIFFGREQHVDRLLEILQREHFLAVIGPSGSGKSSLVRAGLLPALAAGWLGTGSNWRMAVLHPGDRPLRNLALALLEPTVLGPALASSDDEGSDAALIQAELNRGPLGLVHLVEDAVQSGLVAETTQLLVLVDQFEEIFRYRRLGHAQADEADALVSLLLAARAKGEGCIFVALTMRTDFLGNCVQFLELPDAINRAQYLTPRLTRDQLESAITGPARIFGGDVAPDVVNELINTVSEDPDQLPILQHALARMWEEANRRTPDEPEILRDDLDAIGGISGALSRHAGALLDELSARLPDARALTETLFRSITERSETSRRDTRRPARLGLIAEASGRSWRELVPVVEVFAREGVNFLVHGQPLDGDAYVDISHEALIRQWTLLQDWVADEADRADGYRRWRERAVDRAEHGGELLSGADLARALEWRAGTPAWEPAATWARRYAVNESSTAQEFHATLAYIAEGEQRERAEREAEEAAARQRTELERQRLEAERQAAEARAETERERAAAAIREQTMALASVRKSRVWLVIVGGVALVAAALGIMTWMSLKDAHVAKDGAIRAQFAALAAEKHAYDARNWAQTEKERAESALVMATTEKKHAEDAQKVAETERKRANEKARLALAQALEAQARRAVDRTGAGLELSLLLATESLRAAWTYDGYEAWAKAASLLPVRQAVRSIPGGRLTAMALSPDGRWVATGAPTGSITIWNAEDWRELKVLPLQRNDAEIMAFSPDGRWLAAGQGQALRLWRTSDWQPTASVNRPWEAWETLVFNHSGTLLATAAREMFARVFPVNADGTLGEEIKRREFEGPGRIMAAAFAPNGAWFAVGGQGPGVRVYLPTGSGDLWKDIFTATNRTPTVTEIPTNQSTWVMSGLKGDRLLIGARRVELWTRPTDPTAAPRFVETDDSAGPSPGHSQLEHGSAVRAISARPSEDWFATGTTDGTVHVWSVSGDEIARTPPTQVLFGQRAGVGLFTGGNRLVTGNADGSVTFWSLPPSAASASARRAGTVRALGASPDAKWLATGSDDGTTRVFSTPALREVAASSHPAAVSSLAFSANGLWLAVAGGETVRLLGMRDGKPVADRRLPEEIEGLAFSPDNRWLAAIGHGAVHIASTPSWQRTLRIPHAAAAEMVAFSPDGRFVATRTPMRNQRSVMVRPPMTRVFDLTTGNEVAWKSHEKEVNRMFRRPAGEEPAALEGGRAEVLADLPRWPWSPLKVTDLKSPDGRWEVDSGGRLFDKSRQERQSFGSLAGFAFLDGGRWLATAHDDVVSLWPLRPEEIRGESCRRLTRNLRRAEWTKYIGDAYERTCPDLPIPD